MRFETACVTFEVASMMKQRKADIGTVSHHEHESASAPGFESSVVVVGFQQSWLRSLCRLNLSLGGVPEPG